MRGIHRLQQPIALEPRAIQPHELAAQLGPPRRNLNCRFHVVAQHSATAPQGKIRGQGRFSSKQVASCSLPRTPLAFASLPRTLMRAFFLAAAIAAIPAVPFAPAPLADASSCTLAYPADAIEYWTKANPVANSDRCEWQNGTPSCHWYGWLWKSAAATASSGNLPAVVFIHGSGTSVSRGQLCEVVNKLVPLGYVVFMPYMRGVDDSSSANTNHSFHNTGVYIADHVTQDVGPSPTNDPAARAQFPLHKLPAPRSGDNSKPLINTSRIALWGHSYGGAVSVIATGAG